MYNIWEIINTIDVSYGVTAKIKKANSYYYILLLICIFLFHVFF